MLSTQRIVKVMKCTVLSEG